MAYKGQATPTTARPILRAKVSDGKSVVVTVPENTNIEAQTFVEVEGFFGVAMQSISTSAGETEELVINIEQAEYETDNITTTNTFEVGTLIYYDKGTKKLTTTDTGNRLVGRATSAKDSNNVITFILLPQQA